MIKAKRFSFLDEETNVAVSSFTSNMDSGIINSAENALSDASEAVTSLFDSAVQSGKDLLESTGLSDVFSDLTRAAKDAAGDLIDLASLPSEEMDGFFDEMADDDYSVSKSLRSAMQKCGSRGMGYGAPGRPYRPSLNCGAGNIPLGYGQQYGQYGQQSSLCDASQFGSNLNKLSGGNFNGQFNNNNRLLQSLMSMGGYGYNLGMCNVFSSLSNGLPTDVLSRGAGGLLALMGRSGNTNAVLDIAKSSPGLTPLATSPSGIETFLGNYRKPSNVRQCQLNDLGDRTFAGLELLDEDWDKSSYDDMVSISAADGYSEDLAEVFDTKLTDRAYGEDSLDTIPSSDEVFVYSAYGIEA